MLFAPIISVPTDEEILEIRQYLVTNGLPDVEQNTLEHFGWAEQDIMALTESLLTAEDEFFRNGAYLPEMLESLVISITETAGALPDTAGDAVAPVLECQPSPYECGHPEEPPDALPLTCYLDFSGDWDATGGLDCGTLMLNGTVTPESCPLPVDGYQGPGTPDVAVAFNASAVCQILNTGEQPVALTGQLNNQTRFGGLAFVEVETAETAIPTVSEWGLIVLAVLLLVGLKVKFGRRPIQV
jgi:hypothetical protein